MILPVHNIAISESNGPGQRLVIWVQGCHHHCKNCFNPETHSFKSDRQVDTQQIVDDINQRRGICGVTFSGGEPLEYPLALLEIIEKINSNLSIIVFSGYTLEEALSSKERTQVLKQCDLSILGRYDDSLPHPYFGKKFVQTTNRVDLNYFKQFYNVEYTIDKQQVTKTGIFKIK